MEEPRGESTNAELRGGITRSSDEVPEKGMERKGLCHGAKIECANQKWEEPMDKAKPFFISKWEFWEAYKRVNATRARQGATRIDCRFLKELVQDLESNVVGRFSATGADGEDTESKRRRRELNIPTLSDRIARW